MRIEIKELQQVAADINSARGALGRGHPRVAIQFCHDAMTGLRAAAAKGAPASLTDPAADEVGKIRNEAVDLLRRSG